MSKRLACLATVLVASVATTALAQNPRGAASTNLAGKKLAVDYGRPALKGRALDELLKQLPPDRMWRAGENQVTTMTLEGDVMIGGKKVPAGKYSVYVHAVDADTWELVLNKDLGVPLGQIWDKAPDNLKNEPWPHLDDYTKTIAAQPAAGGTPRALTSGDHAIDAWSYAPGTGLHAFVKDEAASPGEIWTMVPGSAPVRVTKVFEGLARDFQLPRQERITWKGADGVDVEGLLFYPTGYVQGQRYPLIVQTHGGPAASDKFGFGSWGSYPEVLARDGLRRPQPDTTAAARATAIRSCATWWAAISRTPTST